MTKPAAGQESETMIGILDEIEKCFTPNFPLVFLRGKWRELGDYLVLLCQRDMVKFRAHAAKIGEPWSGEVLLTSGYNEQDGLFWSGSERVLVGPEIEFLDVVWQTCEAVEKREQIGFLISHDEKSLWQVHHRISKTFRNNGQREEILLLERTVELKDNTIWRVAVIRNIDTPPSPLGSFYYQPRPVVIKYELVLG